MATVSSKPAAGAFASGDLFYIVQPGGGRSTTLGALATYFGSGGGSSGTVTSVAASGGTTGMSFTGGPVTGAGTLTLTGTLNPANGGTGVTTSTGSGSNVLSASPTLTGTVTVPLTPTNATDVASKGYVDALKQALDIKDSVRAASTANVTIASALINGSTMDGVTLATGNRVLLKNQTTASQNGIYVVAASGAASRAVDADVSADVTTGMYVLVSEGTVNGSMGFVLTTPDPIVLATTALTFTQFSGAGQVTAGAGLTKSGNTLDIVGTANRIVVGADSIDIGTDVVTRTGSAPLARQVLQYVGSAWTAQYPTESLIVAVGDETTAIAVGATKVTFRMPYAFKLIAVRASLTTASTSGLPAFDVNRNGTSIFSTTLTINQSAKTSVGAATAAVLSTTDLSDDDEITVDIDTAGTGAAGPKIYLIGYRTA